MENGVKFLNAPGKKSPLEGSAPLAGGGGVFLRYAQEDRAKQESQRQRCRLSRPDNNVVILSECEWREESCKECPGTWSYMI